MAVIIRGVILALLVSICQGSLIAQSGGYINGSWHYPHFKISGGCTALSISNAFSTFLVNSSVEGVYRISVVANSQLSSGGLNVFVYNSDFSESSPCSNLVVNRTLSQQIPYMPSGSGPDIDDFVFLSSSMTYTIVISGVSGSLGAWVAYVYSPDYDFSTSLSSPEWSTPSNSFQEQNCTANTNNLNYFGDHSFIWSSTSGIYDIVVGSVNETFRASSLGSTWGICISVFSGTLNSSVTSTKFDPCTISSSYLLMGTICQSTYGAMLQNVSFTSGKAYSIAASTTGTQLAEFGIYFSLSLFGSLSDSSATWPAPFGATNMSSCTAISNETNEAAFQKYYFTPNVDSILISTTSNSFFNSTQEVAFNYLYSGNYSGKLPCHNFISGGVILEADLSAGNTYTLIISNQNQSDSPGQYLLFAYLSSLERGSNVSSTSGHTGRTTAITTNGFSSFSSEIITSLSTTGSTPSSEATIATTAKLTRIASFVLFSLFGFFSFPS